MLKSTTYRRLTGAVLGLCLALSSIASTAATDSCKPTQVKDWPICSPDRINAASAPLMPFPMMKSQTFSRMANSPPPGRAEIELDGMANARGAACASHVAQVMGDGDLLRAGPEERSRRMQELMQKRLKGEPVPHRVVFQLYTPNIEIQQAGLALDAFSFHHNGLGGWRPNSGANLIIYLPETSPGELQTGQSYPAFAISSGGKQDGPKSQLGWFFTSWQGKGKPVYFQKSSQIADRVCQTLNSEIGKMHDGLVAETGDETLRGRTQFDCKIQEMAFAGRKRYLHGRLTGTVTIDAISRGSLSAHFDLSGNVKLKQQTFAFRYDNRDGRLIGNRKTNETEKQGSLHARGHFLAPNYQSEGYLPSGTPVEIGGDDAPLEKELLHIDWHRPGIDEHNVDWDSPGIRVRFDKAVAMNTLNARTAYIAYRDAQGSMQHLDTVIRSVDSRTIRLLPSQHLKDGVRYRVTLKAGDSGIRGQNGMPLAADYDWDFYTTVNLDDDEAMNDLPEIVKPEEGIEPQVFQVSRNEPLIPKKSTMTRVYVKWKARKDVDPEWQVKRFFANVRVTDAQGGGLYAEKKKVLIQRPDQYSAWQKRQARNSVNFFGWNPAHNQTPTLKAEVEPVSQCDTPRVFKGSRALQYGPFSHSFKIDYYYVATSNNLNGNDWASPRDGDHFGGKVPDWVHTVSPEIARMGGIYTTQNFPVVKTQMRNRGDIEVATWFRVEKGDGKLYSLVRNGVPLDDYVAQQVYSSVSGSDADAVMLVMSHDIQPSLSGYTYKSSSDVGHAPAEIGIFYDLDTQQAYAKLVGTIAHEMGHVYGLVHSPRGQTSNDPIEGFRISADGGSGWNKSSTDGNAEGSLEPFALMRVGADPYKATFITQANYRKLLGAAGISPSLRAPVPDPATRVAALGNASLVEPDPVAPHKVWAVEGFASADEGAAVITALRPVTVTEALSQGRGPYQARVLAADGSTLGAAAFTLIQSPSRTDAKTGKLRPFRVLLPRRGAADRLEIRYQGRTLRTRQRSAHAPQAQLSVGRIEDGILPVHWQGSDPDGDTLRYTLYYSADGSRFHPLAINLPKGEFRIPVPDLNPGARPRLRLVASDGFNETAVTKPVDAAAFAVSATLPGEHGGTVAAAVFNSPLRDAKQLKDGFTLTNAAGKVIEAHAEYDTYSRTARLLPAVPLEGGQSYTAHLAASIADRQGNTLGNAVEWRFVAPHGASIEAAPSRSDSHASGTATATPPAGENEPGGSDARTQSNAEGSLELDGAHFDFAVDKCSQSDNPLTGHSLSLTGIGSDGLRITAGSMTMQGMGHVQRATVQTGAGSGHMQVLAATHRETKSGWVDGHGKPADGPLLKLDGKTLTIEADFKQQYGGDTKKHAVITAHCEMLGN